MVGALFVCYGQEIRIIKSSKALESNRTWVQNLAQLLPLRMPLGKSLHLSELQFPHLLGESKCIQL